MGRASCRKQAPPCRRLITRRPAPDQGNRCRLTVRVWAEVRLLAVAIEDHHDLDGAAVAGDPRWRHRVELGGLAGLDEMLALAEEQSCGALEHIEPIAPGVNLWLGPLLGRRDAHLGDGSTGRIVEASERPVHGAVAEIVADRTNDDIVVVVVTE